MQGAQNARQQRRRFCRISCCVAIPAPPFFFGISLDHPTISYINDFYIFTTDASDSLKLVPLFSPKHAINLLLHSTIG